MEKEKRHTLVDNAALRRYEMDLGGEKAVVEYVIGPGYRILTHTEVPPKFEGQGIGRELVAGVLKDMKSKNLQVIPPSAASSPAISTVIPNGSGSSSGRPCTGKPAPPCHRSHHPAPPLSGSAGPFFFTEGAQQSRSAAAMKKSPITVFQVIGFSQFRARNQSLVKGISCLSDGSSV